MSMQLLFQTQKKFSLYQMEHLVCLVDESGIAQYIGIKDQAGRLIFTDDLVVFHEGGDALVGRVAYGRAEISHVAGPYGEYNVEHEYLGMYVEGLSDMNEALARGECWVVGSVSKNPEWEGKTVKELKQKGASV